jgi:hypothetical protein
MSMERIWRTSKKTTFFYKAVYLERQGQVGLHIVSPKEQVLEFPHGWLKIL